MPDVEVVKPITLDLLSDNKPGTSVTSDMPKVETKPDSVAAPEKAKDTEVSATPDKPESASASDEDGEKKAPAKGVQKRLDELTRNWRDEQRARERSEKLLSDALETMKRIADGKPAQETRVDGDDPEPTEPDANKYTEQDKYNSDYRTYLKNMARWEGRQEYKSLQKKETEAKSKETQDSQYREKLKAYEVHVAKVRTENPDYDAIAGDPTLPISKPMATAIMESGELGPKLVIHLHQNREEAQRISQLSPASQFLELGKLAAKLTSEPVVQVSKAKPPIKPLSSGSTATSSDEESMESYAAKRTKQLQEENRRGVRR